MTRDRDVIDARRRTALALIAVMPMILLAILACNTANMSARDLPVWTCPTETPMPTNTMEPSPTMRPSPTVLPGTATPYPEPTLTPRPTYTPYPSPTPYVLTTDFPLGKHVQVGSAGIGFGIWVWMDNVRIDGPFEITNAVTDQEQTVWVASWDVTVENAAWFDSGIYEFYPFTQIFVIEYIDEQNQYVRKGFPIDTEAYKLINQPVPELTEESAIVNAGEQTTVRAAAIIPGPGLWRMGYIFDPLDTANINEMIEQGTLGSNIGIWINRYDNTCANGEVTPSVGGIDDNSTPLPGTGLLHRHPTDSGAISRGWGCEKWFTGYTNPSCPSDKPNFHNGNDYVGGGARIPLYNPLRTPGVVTWAGPDTFSRAPCQGIGDNEPPYNGYGNVLIIQTTTEGKKLTLWLAHLTSWNYQKGDTVPVGQAVQVAVMGKSGCSDGIHTHMNLQINGQFVNPCLYIEGGCEIY